LKTVYPSDRTELLFAYPGQAQMAVPHDVDESAEPPEVERARSRDEPSDAGGESACFAHLVCPDCGIVVGDAPHRRGCEFAGS
jgi:hypothetical protein